MAIATGRLTDSGVSRLRDSLKKMNKRAKRIDRDEMILTVVQREAVLVKNPTGLDYTVWMNDVEVDGEMPCIDGWVVAARIEFTESGNLVHCAPGVDDLDSKYRTVGPVCNHCNTSRRRNDILVLRHDDGRELCVGRNCVADFCRSGGGEDLIYYANNFSGDLCAEYDEDYDFRGGRVKPIETVKTVVAASSICIRKLGWVSGREAYDYGKGSTKNDVFAVLYPPSGSLAYKDWTKWIKNNELQVTAYDTDLADKAIEWAKSVDTSKSDYLHNLSILAKSDYVHADKFGYLVSIIPAYNRAVERETERAERAASAAAKGRKEFIGEPKKRMKGIKATCTGIRSFEGDYGVTTMIKFDHRIDDSSYAVLTWFASGDKTEDFEVGGDYTFDTTCKKHEDSDKYGKQTLINRLTVK